ncbi:MAG: hydroxymethylpyrimidine/phosphomethylpyrimidine kinase [Burkholderiales bacterium]
MHASPPIVLVFAATDPGGGAGIQADLLTLASLGCHALSVVTAITVQDTVGVEAVLPMQPQWVTDQARCILDDANVAAFKIGLLGSTDVVAAIAEVVSDYPKIPLILDPVLASGRGDELATEEMIVAIRELLIPQTTLLTPNSLELRRLAWLTSETGDATPLGECAQHLLALGCEYVLATGTHENTEDVVNTLYSAGGIVSSDSWPRLEGTFHGSGCTLASACAATIAKGLRVTDAVRDAQEFTWQALKAAFRSGKGQWVPDRLFWARHEDEPNENQD